MKKRIAYANVDRIFSIAEIEQDYIPARKRLVLEDGSRWLVGPSVKDWLVGDYITIMRCHADPAAQLYVLTNKRTQSFGDGRFLWEDSDARTCQELPV
ncbi:MAG: hypothetical protein HYV36_05065 [Lentisphaerae bacterium]|nr:hypothetical protein [Lentisphaerota bacterium]